MPTSCASTTSLPAVSWNNGTWTAPWGLKRLVTSPQDSKDKHSNVCEERPRKVFWDGKVGFHFLLVLVRRQAAVFCCCCWCPGLSVVLQMSTPTTDMNQQSHSWKLSAHDRLLCWIQLYQHKQFARDRGWIITVLTEVTNPTGPLKKKMFALPLISF